MGQLFLVFLLRSLAGETLRSPRSKLPRAAGGYCTATLYCTHRTLWSFSLTQNPGPKWEGSDSADSAPNDRSTHWTLYTVYFTVLNK